MGSTAVLVTHYNSPDDLKLCLESLQRSSVLPQEIVVVDNSTSSHARQHAAQAAMDHNAAWLPMGGNVGYGAAVNRAAKQTSGEFLLALNQDAVLDLTALEDLERYLQDHPICGAASPMVLNPDGEIWFGGGSLSTRTGRLNLDNFGEQPTARSPFATDVLSGCAMMLRKTAFDDIDGFDEQFFLYYEDIDLSLRIRDADWDVAIVPDAVAVHRRGQLGDPRRNLSPTMLTQSLRSRLILASKLPLAQRAVMTATQPIEALRLLTHAVRASPSAALSSCRAVIRGLRLGATHLVGLHRSRL